MQNKIELLPVIYLSKYMHCGILTIEEKISKLPCILNGVGSVVLGIKLL